MKVRLGRGFSLEELKVTQRPCTTNLYQLAAQEAGISAKLAPTIGIAVDHRRMNHSVESLQSNIQRLKEYRARLVLFPRKASKPRQGDASKEEIAQVSIPIRVICIKEYGQNRRANIVRAIDVMQATQLTGPLMPYTKPELVPETMEITEEMNAFRAHSALRIARNDKKLQGLREVRHCAE
jgi:large subunit ribosomal protein L13e